MPFRDGTADDPLTAVRTYCPGMAPSQKVFLLRTDPVQVHSEIHLMSAPLF